MIRDAIRALRLFRSESRVDTVVALVTVGALLFSFVEDRR